jgi:general secretion pathway protein F
MPIYEYRGITREGRQARGTLDAPGPAGVREKLKGRGVYIREIRELGRTPAAFGLSLSVFKRRGIITAITRQLAFLLGASLPVDSAFEGVIDQAEDAAVKRMLVDIKDKIKEGKTVSQALAAHPDYFTPMYVSTVRAGEISGKLDVVFDRLSRMYEKNQALVSKLRSSLTYPVLMLLFAILVVVFLVSFIVPTFAKLFTEFGGVLPAPTRVLIGVSNVVSSAWWAILAAAALAGYVLARLYRSERGKRRFDAFVLRVPLVKRLVLDNFRIRFCYTLALMLAGGVGILEALENTKGVFGNTLFREAIENAIERVRKGEKLSRALAAGRSLLAGGGRRRGAAGAMPGAGDSHAAGRIFTSSLLGMIHAGEAGDRVADVLERIAAGTEVDMEERIKTITSLVEPIVILAIGLFVGFVVLSIMLPIFQINTVFG